jgi:L-serine dehydratase
MARKMFPEPIQQVTFTLYGSFAKTYRGHGTDRALLGGILGFATDDERIRDAYEHAKNMGVKYEFVIDEDTQTNHPNTADIDITGVGGHTLSIRGESIGGGKMKIVRIDNIDVEFTGEYSTLIVHQQDKPGVVAHITQALSEQDVNIAFMRLFRENKGANAYTVVESDEHIPEKVLEQIRTNPNVDNLMLIQL